MGIGGPGDGTPGPEGDGAGQTEPSDDRPLPGTGAADQHRRTRLWPWPERPRAVDLVCIAGLVLSGVYYLATIPLTPVLIATHPVLLEILSGSSPSIVAAGAFSDIDSKLQLTVVVAAALPGLMKFDLLYWWAGVLWGRRALTWFGVRSQKADTVSMLERRGARFAGPLVLLSAFLPVAPTPLIYAAVGSVGLGPVAFVVFDTIGSTAWAILLAVLGYQLGPSGVAVANLVSRYALISALVLLAVALAPQAWHLLRAWRARARERARLRTSGDAS